MTPTGPLIRRLLRLAWPTALARLGIMGMSVVDVMVVGRFVPAQLPDQALGWAPINVLSVSGIGLLTGVQVLTARALGAGIPEQAGGAWRRGMLVAGLVGAIAVALVWLLGAHVFTSFGIAPELGLPASRVARILVLSVPFHLGYVVSAFFLEAVQRPLASTVVMWGANAVNLALNLALVPLWGAEGSAWCTVASRVCLCAALGIWVWRHEQAEYFGVRRPAVAPALGALLRVGGAAAVSHAAESGAFSGMTMLAGRLGGNAVAAYQILLNLLAIVFMVSLGVSSATAVLTSEATGRKAPAEATRTSFVGVALNTALMSIAALLLVGFASAIGRAYTTNASIAAAVSGLMWLAGLSLLPDGGQAVAAAALRARGDNWFPTVSHLLAYALVMPALAYWLAEVGGGGINGLMVAIGGASALSCGVLCLRLWRLDEIE